MAKSESPDIEVGKMYFGYADHFPGRISSMCKLSSVVKAIEEKLTNRQLRMFKKEIAVRIAVRISYGFKLVSI